MRDSVNLPQREKNYFTLELKSASARLRIPVRAKPNKIATASPGIPLGATRPQITFSDCTAGKVVFDEVGKFREILIFDNFWQKFLEEKR